MTYLTTYGPVNDDSEIVDPRYLTDSREGSTPNAAAIHAFVGLRCRDWNADAQKEFVLELFTFLGCHVHEIPDQIGDDVAKRLANELDIDLTTAADGTITRIDWTDEQSEIATHWAMTIEAKASREAVIIELCSKFVMERVADLKEANADPGTPPTTPG